MPWKPTSEVLRGRALRNLSTFRKAIAEVTQKHVAEQVEVAAPTLSDFNNDQMERACLVLAAAGLRVVGFEEKTISPEDWRAYHKERIRNSERELEECGGATRPGDL